MPSFEKNLFTQRHQITSEETRDSRLSYGEDPESLSHLALNAYRVVTDRLTDRIPLANTRSRQYLPVQLSRVKTKKDRNKQINIATIKQSHHVSRKANFFANFRSVNTEFDISKFSVE